MITICWTHIDAMQRWRRYCPTCRRVTTQVGWRQEWYGWHVTCLRIEMSCRTTRRMAPPQLPDHRDPAPNDRMDDDVEDYDGMVVATVVVCLTVLLLGVVTPIVLVWWLIGW